MYNHTGIGMTTVAMEMSSHSGFVIVFDVKYVTMESVNYSVFGLTYMLYVAPVAIQTIYEIITLACFCNSKRYHHVFRLSKW